MNAFLLYQYDVFIISLLGICMCRCAAQITDLKAYVNNEVLSDIQFIVEGIPIHAHKVLEVAYYYYGALAFDIPVDAYIGNHFRPSLCC